LTDKLGEIDFKLEELARTSETKIAEVKEENLNHNTRLGGIETQVEELNDKIREREQLEIVEAQQARLLNFLKTNFYPSKSEYLDCKSGRTKS
jgi:hypothetical protein